MRENKIDRPNLPTETFMRQTRVGDIDLIWEDVPMRYKNADEFMTGQPIGHLCPEYDAAEIEVHFGIRESDQQMVAVAFLSPKTVMLAP